MSKLRSWFARALLGLFGWRVEAGVLPGERAILLGAPHTSNWDFPLCILTFWALELRVRWMGKSSLFVGPAGWFFRMLGGLPVDRSGGRNTVDAVVALFEERESLLLGITPSGTRSASEHWKSGFYHIACRAQVPVLLAAIDFGRRSCTFLERMELSGDVERDMDHIRSVYEPVRGRFPELQTPVRLAREGPTGA